MKNYPTDLFVQHLSEMIQFPTVSCAAPEEMDMSAYTALHQYLERAYPLVHKIMS